MPDSQVLAKQIRFNAWNAIMHLDVVTTPGAKPFHNLSVDGILGPKSAKAFTTMGTVQPDWLTETPPPNTCAVDSLAEVSAPLLARAQKIGKNPVWWARYTSHTKYPDVCAVSAKEVSLLKSQGIPLQAVAANAARFGLLSQSEKVGVAEAKRDIRHLETIRGLGDNVLRRVFLDVEGSSTFSRAFYKGWSRTLVEAGWEPAVYMPNKKNHPAQWVELEAAIAAGAVCAGTWSAWYAYQTKEQIEKGTTPYMALAWEPCYAQNNPLLDCAWQCLGQCEQGMLDFTVFPPNVKPWW
jgi:hypothetical protein